MTWSITVGGVVKEIKKQSLRISEANNGRNTLSAQILSSTGTYRPALDAEVIVTDNGVRVFGGVVRTAQEKGLGDLGVVPIVTTINASDFNVYADFRLVTIDWEETNPAKTLKDVLVALMPYLQDYGITLDPAQVAGPNMPALRYVDKTPAQIMNDLTQRTDYVWNIDYNKVLSMKLPTANAAPWNVIDGNTHVDGDITVEPTREGYFNKLFLHCGGAVSPPKMSRQQSWNAPAKTVAGKSYYFTTYQSTQEPPFDTVWRDAAGDPCGAYGSGQIWEFDRLAEDPQCNGLSCLIHNDTLAGGPVPGGVVVSFAYVGDLPFVVEYHDDVEIAAHGLQEQAKEAPDLTDWGSGLALVTAMVEGAVSNLRSVAYMTRDSGLHPGQTQTITVASRNLNTTFLITDVTITNDSGNLIRYDIKLVEGTKYRGSWKDKYRQWNGAAPKAAVSAGVAGALPGSNPNRQVYFLGGSAAEYVRDRSAGPNPNYIAASPMVVTLDPSTRGTNTVTVYVRMRAADAGVGVTPRLRNITDGTTAGTGDPVISQNWTIITFQATLAAGAKRYQLELLPSVLNKDVAAIGYLE